jgi:hypothetical protein
MIWNGNSYSQTSFTAYTTIYSRDVRVAPRLSRRERRMRDALQAEGLSKLQKRLRREEADRRARSDAASRRRSAPVSGAPAADHRLQTYDDAMAARMAARRAA